jgi:acyl-CoA synthetase (NDP forming)
VETKSRLDRLFNPQTIAFIGASGNPAKWGFIVPLNILKGQFRGTLYPVNPGCESLLGIPCLPSVSAISVPVDLAVITTPARTVPDLVDECGRKGVANVVVISSDFSETGPEGAALERDVVARARKYGMRIVGPNTMGLYSSSPRLNALMPPVAPLDGPLSMVSQSGNVGVQMLYWGNRKGLGFEKFVSSGNEADLTCEDYLDYFGGDKATRVVLAYMEGIDGDSGLLDVARRVSRRKPVLIFKGGRTSTGNRAASSHSGAMAVSSRVLRAAFRQAGVIGIEDSQGLIDAAKAFSAYPVPRGNRVGILTRGGGWGVITADACEERGLEVPPLPDRIVRRLNRILPSYWSHGNPVDMAANMLLEPFMECIEALAEWDGVDSVIAMGGSIQGIFDFDAHVEGTKELKETITLAREVAKEYTSQHDVVLDHTREMVEKTGKPVIVVTLGDYDGFLDDLKNHRVVSYPTPERAVTALKHMVDYRRFLDSPIEPLEYDAKERKHRWKSLKTH